MTLRHVALAAGTALVLAVAVYLFIEVRAKPASAQVKHVAQTTTPPPAPQRAPAVDEETDPRYDMPTNPRPVTPVVRSPSEKPMAQVVRESGNVETPSPSVGDPKLAAVMDEANKAYDAGDLDEAKAIALRVLATAPGNTRMLRIVVSASCISGDSAEAQKAYLQLPRPDREQMKVRCARYGATFNE